MNLQIGISWAPNFHLFNRSIVTSFNNFKSQIVYAKYRFLTVHSNIKAQFNIFNRKLVKDHRVCQNKTTSRNGTVTFFFFKLIQYFHFCWENANWLFMYCQSNFLSLLFFRLYGGRILIQLLPNLRGDSQIFKRISGSLMETKKCPQCEQSKET